MKRPLYAGGNSIHAAAMHVRITVQLSHPNHSSFCSGPLDAFPKSLPIHYITWMRLAKELAKGIRIFMDTQFRNAKVVSRNW